MKRIIAIIAGGDSSEHDVSLRSAQGIYSFLDKDRYDVYIVEITGMNWEAVLQDGTRAKVDINDFSFQVNNQRIRPDYCYITIHGTPGENGLLQGYFDLIRMPYSTSGVLVEALTFNKFTLNQYLKSWGISVSESIMLRKGQQISNKEVIERVGLPCFIKPNAGGSSFGVTKVKKEEDIQPAIELAMQEEGAEVMIEAFMKGTEISCGHYVTKQREVALPITEVVPANEFFDYNAKYNGEVQEITPARIPDEVTDRVHQLNSAIYRILGCNGIIRVDYIISDDNKINMLEINTTPGMTATSFIPQQVHAAGMDMKDVLTEIIENQFSN
ncbi:MAG: D-alanine--D-alanine ligase [Bacteroidaceae bacterium]|nr:D-alanine--D-alanine ligase [Bacteroidaceae bacterium]